MIGIHNKQTSCVTGKKFKSVLDALKYETKQLELGCSQIFTHGPKNFNKNNVDEAALKEYCAENDVRLYIHCNYLSVGIWNVNKSNAASHKSKLMIDYFIDQFETCINTGALGMVLHLSKKPPNIICDVFDILNKVPRLKKLLSAKAPVIILEMPATRPKSYENPDNLNQLARLLNKKSNKIKWGYCIDTAHLWAAGLDISSASAWREWKSQLSPENIILIHLNGALSSNFGTGNDEHIIPFSKSDAIWSKYLSKKNIDERDVHHIKQSSFYLIVKYCQTNDIDIIFEVNRGTQKEFLYCLQLTNLIRSID